MKYKTLKYLKSITQILKILENYFLDIANESKFVKYRALENNRLYWKDSKCLDMHIMECKYSL